MLVHFTRSKDTDTSAELHSGGTTIKPVTEAKYLGVIFDKELSFKSHVDSIVKKGTKFGLAIAGIARSRWGAGFKYLRT